MRKFKLKIVKVTKTEKITILSLLLLIVCLPLLINQKPEEKQIVYPVYEYDKIIDSFAFDGKMISEVVFDEKFASLIYENDDKLDSHLINLEKNKKVKLNDFIKDDKEDDFNKKIYELLLYKYPKKYAKLLWDNSKEYFFYETYLYITFDKLDNINRTFDLKVYYNEIADYLEFTTIKVDEPTKDGGFNYDPNKISISFTFDDGPNGKKTQELISVFEDYKMSATFFMVANKLYNDKETVKIVADSHSEIGYHSFAHAYFTKQTPKQIKEEFASANKMLKDICGKEFKLTRPPYGAYNQKVLDSIESSFIRWDLDTNDWRYKDVDYIQKYVLDNYKDGSIILFHDSYSTSIESATKLIDTFFLMDVQILSVTELAKIKGINLENHKAYYSFTK